jgi:uncharacterized SAM-binding protein YcdF (DUF218 family)
MKTLRKIARFFYGFFAFIGFLVIFVSFTPFVSWWAYAYAGSIDQPNGDVLILLSAAGDDENGGGIAYSSYWRARQALYAWQTGSFKKIVICGPGDPGIYDFLLAQGIPSDVFVLERRSTSTRENALETARILQSLPGRKVLLTSDFHMLRALAVFHKLKIDVAPMAVPDALHATEHWPGRFPAFETMVVESAKIAYYELRGWM